VGVKVDHGQTEGAAERAGQVGLACTAGADDRDAWE
jgi:hypothetical protein